MRTLRDLNEDAAVVAKRSKVHRESLAEAGAPETALGIGFRGQFVRTSVSTVASVNAERRVPFLTKRVDMR